MTRTEIQTGVTDDTWVEVRKKAAYPTKGNSGTWEDFTAQRSNRRWSFRNHRGTTNCP